MAMHKSEIICVISVLIIAMIAVTACVILNQNDDGEKSVKDCMDSVVEIKCETSGEKSYGTGFIIDQDGPKVITCAHVVTHTVTDKKQSHDSIQCSFYNSDESHQLNMICFDSEKDIAVLSFESQPDKVSCIAFSEDNTDYGDKAYIIGNSMNYGLSVKDGLVSVPKLTVVKDNAKRDCIMISVSINSGDSGAPIIDSDNRVIGMASFRLRDSGTTIQGMGYGVLTSDIVSYLYNVADTH